MMYRTYRIEFTFTTWSYLTKYLSRISLLCKIWTVISVFICLKVSPFPLKLVKAKAPTYKYQSCRGHCMCKDSNCIIQKREPHAEAAHGKCRSTERKEETRVQIEGALVSLLFPILAGWGFLRELSCPQNRRNFSGTKPQAQVENN